MIEAHTELHHIPKNDETLQKLYELTLAAWEEIEDIILNNLVHRMVE